MPRSRKATLGTQSDTGSRASLMKHLGTRILRRRLSHLARAAVPQKSRGCGREAGEKGDALSFALLSFFSPRKGG